MPQGQGHALGMHHARLGLGRGQAELAGSGQIAQAQGIQEVLNGVGRCLRHRGMERRTGQRRFEFDPSLPQPMVTRIKVCHGVGHVETPGCGVAGSRLAMGWEARQKPTRVGHATPDAICRQWVGQSVIDIVGFTSISAHYSKHQVPILHH